MNLAGGWLDPMQEQAKRDQIQRLPQPVPVDMTLTGKMVSDSPFQQNAEQKFQANMRASQAAQAQKLELEMQERAQMAHEMALERARRDAGR